MKNPALCFLLLFTAFAFSTNVPAQNYNQSDGYLKANSKWVFGTNIGWDKTLNNLFPVSGLNASGATLSVADSATGQLLFYSNGVQCWTATGQLMPNGSNIGGEGNGGRTQPVCAVPFVTEPGKYFLFALSDPFSSNGVVPGNKGKLYYSILDMSLNNGAGDIVPGQKAILLDSLLGSSIIAIPGNQCDVWLMAHALYSSTYKAYHITAAGLDLNPVVSATGPVVDPTPVQFGGNSWRLGYTQGQMSVSPDRSKIAYGVISLNGIPLPPGTSPLGFVLSRFNPDNGTVTETLQFNEGDIHVYGTGFSPDNTKLYINVVASGNNTTNGIIQYDISNYNTAAIAGSAMAIFPMTAGSIKQKYIKLYHDTLYLSNQSTGGVPTLSVITDPNQPGILCGYQNAAVSLTGAIVQGITNDIVFAMPADTLYHTLLDVAICADMVPMILEVPAGRTAYRWDNASGNRQRIINQRGTYWAYSNSGCKVHSDTFIVTGTDVKAKLGADTTICNQASFLLQPLVSPDAAYLWQDGSHADSLLVSVSGTYWISVSKDGCTNSDSINVTIADLRQDLGPDDTACKDIPVALTLKAKGTGRTQVTWSDGSTANSLAITTPGTFWVQASQGICKASDTIRVVRELCDCHLMVPNAFSPNNDGINDLFMPQIEPGCAVSGYELYVYNRWGQNVFYYYGHAATGWDGRFQGKPCDAGTYFFYVKMKKGTTGIGFKQQGELVLLR